MGGGVTRRRGRRRPRSTIDADADHGIDSVRQTEIAGRSSTNALEDKTSGQHPGSSSTAVSRYRRSDDSDAMSYADAAARGLHLVTPASLARRQLDEASSAPSASDCSLDTSLDNGDADGNSAIADVWGSSESGSKPYRAGGRIWYPNSSYFEWESKAALDAHVRALDEAQTKDVPLPPDLLTAMGRFPYPDTVAALRKAYQELVDKLDAEDRELAEKFEAERAARRAEHPNGVGIDDDAQPPRSAGWLGQTRDDFLDWKEEDADGHRRMLICTPLVALLVHGFFDDPPRFNLAGLDVPEDVAIGQEHDMDNLAYQAVVPGLRTGTLGWKLMDHLRPEPHNGNEAQTEDSPIPSAPECPEDNYQAVVRGLTTGTLGYELTPSAPAKTLGGELPETEEAPWDDMCE